MIACAKAGLGEWVFAYPVDMVLELIEHDVELELLKNGKTPPKEVKSMQDLHNLQRRLNG